MTFRSKLPDVGTTIFTVMSRRAAEEHALNIGQGFPDYPVDPRLAELVGEVMAQGFQQYAPMEGVVPLRATIAAKLRANLDVDVDPEHEITVTSGGTEALFSAIQAIVAPGDEVVMFDPSYDVYEPAVRLAGGRAIRLPLQPPRFHYDWDRVRAAINAHTRLIIVNNPLNPACTVANDDDIATLSALASKHDLYVLADEVYEHVVLDGRRHRSVLADGALRGRSIVAYSFGKTLHATGWRVGYAIAPRELTRELRKVHQFNTFSVVAPLQHAIARYVDQNPSSWRDLSQFFQAKRDRLLQGLRGSGFVLRPAEGTYFQLLDYSELAPDVGDVAFAESLIRDAKIATIPLSPFYASPPPLRCIRVCIAKRDDTLDEASARLAAFGQSLGRAGA